MKILKILLLVLLCTMLCFSVSAYGHKEAYFNKEFSYKLFANEEYWERQYFMKDNGDLEGMLARAEQLPGYKGYYYSNGLGKCQYKNKQTVLYAAAQLNAEVFKSVAENNNPLVFSEYYERKEVGVYVGGKAYKKLSIGDRFDITLDNGKAIRAVVTDKIADDIVLPGLIKGNNEYDAGAQKYGIVIMPDIIDYADGEKGYPVIVYDESITEQERLAVYAEFKGEYVLALTKWPAGPQNKVLNNLMDFPDSYPSDAAYLYAFSVAAAVVTALMLFCGLLKHGCGKSEIVIVFAGGPLILTAFNLALWLVFNNKLVLFNASAAVISAAAYPLGAAAAVFAASKTIKRKIIFGDGPDLYRAGKMNYFSLSMLIVASLSLIAAAAGYFKIKNIHEINYKITTFYNNLIYSAIACFAFAAVAGAVFMILNLKLKNIPNELESGRLNEQGS